MSSRDRARLPESLRSRLLRIGETLRIGALEPSELRAAIADLAALPPEAVAAAGKAIVDTVRLWHQPQGGPDRGFQPIAARRKSDRERLAEMPDLRHLFLFHEDGYLREEALHAFDEGAGSRFFLAAIVYRLNDWAPPVRAAALACSVRVLSKTDPRILADTLSSSSIARRPGNGGRRPEPSSTMPWADRRSSIGSQKPYARQDRGRWAARSGSPPSTPRLIGIFKTSRRMPCFRRCG